MPQNRDMQIIQQKIVLKDLQYVRKCLQIFDVLLNINFTPKELDILAFFIFNSKEGIITSKVKKDMQEHFDISVSSVSQYIKALLAKKVIMQEGNVMKVRNFLIPATPYQGFQIKVVLDEDSNKV